MGYRKFNADNLFDGYLLHDNNKVLVTDENGKIYDIVPLADAGDGIEKMKGILSPGLINCHCHLELSHLKDVIPPHTGLIEFLCSVVTKRGFDPAIIQQKIKEAELEMYNNGIMAIGDIGNTADTAFVKSKSKLYWQNFVEVLGFTDEKAVENIKHYKAVVNELEKKNLTNNQRSNLVPHAPYSISPKTFELINKETEGKIISIHNQEHPAEDELYKTGGGDYLKLFKIFGIEKTPFPVTGKSSLQSCLPYFNRQQTIFLIHNTYMPEEDILFAKEYAEKNNLSLIWCLCVNANLYIENKVPPVELFMKHNLPIVLGTDSYSSNWQLSIVKEIQSIHQYFPAISLETILQWATINGAKALQWDHNFGSFEKNKTPGVVVISSDLSESKRIL
ncbi:MAG: amidohydrolase family protein [Bacteroidetes bacterium]|nr:amidohydrolase family protein [Bacteroidota bacterium]